MRVKILKSRFLIEKSIEKNKRNDLTLAKNQFVFAAPLINRKHRAIFDKLIAFEKMNLSSAELIDFKRYINTISMPELITDTQYKKIDKYFNGLNKYDIEKIIHTFAVKDFIVEHAKKTNISETKMFELYYLQRNLIQELRIRKAFRILIKYTNRELDSKINKNCHLR